MKRFVCYTVEGLVEQNGSRVWVTVATLSDPDQACNIKLAEEYLDVRVLPYYRDVLRDAVCEPAHATPRHHLPAPITALPIFHLPTVSA